MSKKKDTHNTKFEQYKCEKPKIYFDNNATTLISPEVKRVFNSWMECYNPSTSSKFAKGARDMIIKVKNEITKLNNCADYTIIFTSGASESNCFILRSVVDAYYRKKNKIPHIITSEIEHHSIIDCIDQLVKDKKATATKITPDIFGSISPEKVEGAIQSNTALISIMYANNEIGTINNIPKIGQIAHKHKIPMHSDCVAIYGKYKIDLKTHNIDVCSASIHKFFGPKGIGLLIINNKLIEGYGLTAIINGTQQGYKEHTLRGGTENVPAIMATGEAIRQTFIRRQQKNTHMKQLLLYFIKLLEEHYEVIMYDKIATLSEKKIFKKQNETKNQNQNQNKNQKQNETKNKKEKYKICIIGPELSKSNRLPNTLLISIIKNPTFDKPFCNVLFKKALDKQGLVVSIGSACNTSSKNASHVLTAINAPQIVLSGILRISICDTTTKKNVENAVKIFYSILN